ncbi:tripartite tricarboxylate transporter substrate binding protein [Diaphorobacter ruginosibacter]|uniref:Tripartite tricarboxylate transporter substrate binding protein n=1 Tax=Diaphorobacter ruginosibacter TaxID=1715720 RepID=A0A7G9RNZ9_9BURK|nr:tripartite tricarboxylate transporter substrate binding protein [Diaphorobacter ruginosibacter]QNN57324.1 tripartite tricarboxylate transporter substrate binding protein [Diaphorobacter ruginosibacter]
MPDRRRFLATSTALALPSLIPSLARAEKPWPQGRTIRVVIPYVAGGVSDSVGRRLIQQVADVLGASIIVDNKGGAGGTVGMAEVARSKADGYTLALSAISPVTLMPHLMKLPYKSDDVIAVAPMMYSPIYLMATTAFKGKTLEDMIAQAKAKPGSVRWATSGIGSVGHIMLEQVQARTGAEFIHVPYKGIAQTVTDAASAQFEVMTGNPFGTINSLIDQGKLRLLAVTGPKRAPNQPEVPTLAEKGLAEANLTSMFGFLAPAGTPADIVAKLNAVLAKEIATPAIQEAMHHTDNIPMQQSAADFEALLQKESRNNAAIVQKAGIKL